MLSSLYMSYVVSLTSQGQISIPIDLRRKFNLDSVRKAIVEAVEDTIVIRPVKSINQLYGSLRTPKHIKSSSVRPAFEDALAKESV